MKTFNAYTDKSPEKVRERYLLKKFRDSLDLESPSCFRGKVVSVPKVYKGETMQVYYFDELGQFRKISVNKKAFRKNELDVDVVVDGQVVLNYKTLDDYNATYSPALPRIVANTVLKMEWLKKAIDSLEPNVSTVDDLVENYNLIVKSASEANGFDKNHPMVARSGVFSAKTSKTNEMLQKSEVSDELARFIYRINVPTYERVPENSDRQTFDFVRIRLGVPPEAIWQNRKQFISENLREIVNLVLNYISESKVYQRYGVPVNFLKLENAVLTRQSELELLFTLKGQVAREEKQ